MFTAVVEVEMKRRRSLSSYFLQEECTQTSQEDVVRDFHDFEASSTTSATPPCTEAPSDDATSTSMSSKVRTSSSSHLMGSSASKSPRIDRKPSWKDRYLVDFERESQEIICMVCDRCVRSDTVGKHFSRVHKDLRLHSLTERRKVQLSYMKYCSAVQNSLRNLKKYLHLHLTSWRSSLHSVKKHLVIVICV